MRAYTIRKTDRDGGWENAGNINGLYYGIAAHRPQAAIIKALLG
jgi:hypothetical protein